VFSSSKGGAEDMVAEMLVTNDLVFISCTEALLHYLLGTKDEPPWKSNLAALVSHVLVIGSLWTEY
jgi:hypothetical protein